VFGYASYRFNKGWRASTNLGYNSPQVLLQGSSAGYLFNSISVNKQFLKDNNASIGFSVNSPFQQKRHSFTEINDPNFYQLQESYYQMRRYNISFGYRFGKLKGDIARKKRGIKNDDLKGGGGGDVKAE
jgi:hypothetical protein